MVLTPQVNTVQSADFSGLNCHQNSTLQSNVPKNLLHGQLPTVSMHAAVSSKAAVLLLTSYYVYAIPVA